MASTMEDCVIDFDIDLLQHLSKFDAEKARKSMRLTKTKVTSTNSLLKKYHNKGVICKSLENCLLTTKEAYKQSCIDRMELREKCASLEQEVEKLLEANKEMENKYITAENQYEGIQSHCKQLELLVKENETTIDSLKIENELEKSTFKDFEKKYAALQKENDYLIKNICSVRDIVFGKKIPTKEIKSFLNKYGKLEAVNECEEENSSDETDAFDECLSPLDPGVYNNILGSPVGNKNSMAVKILSTNINRGNISNRDDNDQDSESSNEIVSSDTGRGSSLAFSDSDKCSVLSPEYFIHHSPLSAEVNKDKMVMSIATSPILTREFISIATSPIIFRDFSEQMDIVDSELEITSQGKRKSNADVPTIMVDREVSPILATQYVNASTITDRYINCDIATSPLKSDNKPSDYNYDSDHNSQEKECLYINNSNNLSDENSNDGEIQMILDTMRFNHQLITPIPTTPAKSRSEIASNIATQTSTHSTGVCLDAAKVKEEYMSLQRTVAKLAQNVININNILKCSPSIINEIALNPESHKMLQDNYLMKFNEGLNVCNEELEAKTSLVQNKDVFKEAGSVKKVLNFKGRISKMKDLFDDSSLPTPINGLLQQPPITSSRSPSPQSPVSQTLPVPLQPLVSPRPLSTLPMSPTPVSPFAMPLPPSSSFSVSVSPMSQTSVLPPSPVADPYVNISDNNNTASHNSRKSKEKVHFEDDNHSNEGSVSDQEIFYEHEIVVELTPDSHESDRNTLHEMLKAQLLQQQVDEDAEDVPSETKNEIKPKKMSRLEKLRKNMVPKNKIKTAKLQGGKAKGKLRIQPKRLTANKQRILDSDSVVDPKAAYEKARKVMAELRSKEKGSSHDAQNLIPDLCQTTIRSKERTFVTSLQGVEVENQKKYNPKTTSKSIKTCKSALQDKDLTSSALKRSVRTRSQNKSIDGTDVNNIESNEEINFNTNHLTSPSLKSYGRNRIAHKGGKCINNNSTLTPGFVNRNVYDSVKAEEINKNNTEVTQSQGRKGLKRPSVDKPEIIPKRILRSSSIQHAQTEEENHDESTPDTSLERMQYESSIHKEIISYNDLELFEGVEANKQVKFEQEMPNVKHDSARHNRDQKYGILCTFLDKYGSTTIKRAPKIPENIINSICKQLEDNITDIQKLPPKDAKHAMDKLVKDLQNRSEKQLLSGFIKYLKEPARKTELYNKIFAPPAPAMTKVEQILLYIVAQLNSSTAYYIIDNMLDYIEYTLFMLNRTPEFDIIETLSHFYAVLCRYTKNRNRLRLFIIDAMYCLHYKAVPLIKQCLDVWMHILPLAHMGIAKNPLVTCLVYLLHFFKCEDKFNRVQDIRNILHRKYFYEVSEWNETGILEMFRNSILELRDFTGEKKMLRMALIILAKRNGARWCQNHIIKNMLLPIIEDAGAPDRIKHFCVSLLGPLLKPYPMDMKVNCEIVMNQLFDMLKRNPTTQMEEAIFTSLIYMSRHNHYRVIRALLGWKPERVSLEFEELLKNYVKERSLKSWKQVLSKTYIN